MTIASASKSRVARVAEATFGTTPATPTFLEMRRISGNMRTKKTTVVSDELHLDRNVRGEYQTGQDPDGSYGFELSYGSFDDLLAAALFGAWTNNALINGTTGQSFTFEETIDTGGGTYAYSRFAGCAVSSLALTIAARAGVKGTLAIMGQAETLDSAILTGATYTAPPTTRIMTADQVVGSLTVPGLPSAPKVKQLSLTVGNNLRVRPWIGSLYSLEFGVGEIDVTGTADVYFESNALYAQVLAHGTGSISSTIGSTTTQKYTIAVPVAQFLDGARTLAGKNDDVMVSIPFRGVLDAVSGGSISIARGVA